MTSTIGSPNDKLSQVALRRKTHLLNSTTGQINNFGLSTALHRSPLPELSLFPPSRHVKRSCMPNAGKESTGTAIKRRPLVHLPRTPISFPKTIALKLYRYTIFLQCFASAKPNHPKKQRQVIPLITVFR